MVRLEQAGEADATGDIGLSFRLVAAQVRIDQDHALAALGQDDCQVGGGGRLALVNVGAGEDQRLEVVCGGEETQVAA